MSLLKKITIYFFISIFLIIGIYKLTPNNIQRTISTKILKHISPKLKLVAGIIFLDHYDIRNFKNDYNVSFLPNTQFTKLDFKERFFDFDIKESINYLSYQKNFFIEIIDDDVWIIDSTGSIRKANFIDIKKNITKKIKTSNIKTNLKNKIVVIGTYVHDKKIYFSFLEYKDSCETLNIIFAKINSEILNFQNYYNSTECGKGIGGGRMQSFEHDNMTGLLVTVAAVIPDKPSERAQDDNSIFGKILFIDSKSKKVINFSKGHRTPQGLYAKKNLILSTEHGPRGGDEINKIIFNKNYGWPISSYGETYSSIGKKKNNLDFKKSHNNFGFEEPVFSFVPSIGISQLIKLPNDFSNQWIDNFIITSLQGKSIFRIKFDNNYKNILFYEKIYIGQRIRDIKYHHKLGAILLALENKGQLGILREK